MVISPAKQIIQVQQTCPFHSCPSMVPPSPQICAALGLSNDCVCVHRELPFKPDKSSFEDTKAHWLNELWMPWFITLNWGFSLSNDHPGAQVDWYIRISGDFRQTFFQFQLKTEIHSKLAGCDCSTPLMIVEISNDNDSVRRLKPFFVP